MNSQVRHTAPDATAVQRISLVVPMYNEGEAIDVLFKRLDAVLPTLAPYLFEIVCVNDGSGDDTLARLEAVAAARDDVVVVDLTRNFGKEAALSAGLSVAAGAAVIPLDADLQDPPEVIAQLIAKWEEGYEVVLARRADRSSDSWAKRFTARSFYRVHNTVADVKIPDDVGDFRLMDRVVVEALNALPESRRFMKGLFAWVGFRTATVEYARDVRSAGETKFNAWKLWNFALEGIASFSISPLRVWTYVGVLVALIAMGWGGWIAVRTLVWGVDVPGYASLLVAVLFLGGLQLIGIGIVGEYLGRAFIESKRRPAYLIREVLRPGAPRREWPRRSLPVSAGKIRPSTPTVRPDSTVSVVSKRLSARLAAMSWPGLSLLFIVVACVLQLPLFVLPGYFSHDDLQWLAFSEPPVAQWRLDKLFGDILQFQYRPLTFTLWLTAGKWFGDSVVAMHTVRALFGIANAGLLAVLLRTLGVSRVIAVTAAWLWLCLPTSVYTNAWIGTYADALCLLFALVTAIAVSTPRVSATQAGGIAFLATMLALLSKEVAIVFPALALCCYMFGKRDRKILAATIGAAVAVAIYMAIRWRVILFPVERVGRYEWSIGNVPDRLIDYLLYPFALTRFESTGPLDRPIAWLAAVVLLLMVGSLARAGASRVRLLAALFVCALGPALILPLTGVHYAFLAVSCAVVVFALAWQNIVGFARVCAVAGIAICMVHGAQVARLMYRTTDIQHTLYEDLRTALSRPGAPPIAIRAERMKDNWIVERMLVHVPRYRGMQIEGRVDFASFFDPQARVTHLMSPSGHLRAVEK